MENIITAVIASITMIAVAIFEGINFKDKKRSELRAKRRSEETYLSMELMSANAKLAMIIAKKVMNQKTNGDVEEAFLETRAALSTYEEFKTKLTSETVVKI